MGHAGPSAKAVLQRRMLTCAVESELRSTFGCEGVLEQIDEAHELLRLSAHRLMRSIQDI